MNGHVSKNQSYIAADGKKLFTVVAVCYDSDSHFIKTEGGMGSHVILFQN